ncbi:acyloxyacyl hydrolase [Rhodanobacter ginsengisoli]|uniref:Acyloxyacyl hydrolase n=1 Tax=Rhodanobacter ginsengisoli TaxID=418646 RepID=A0ABW0QTC7_9GAMM
MHTTRKAGRVALAMCLVAAVFPATAARLEFQGGPSYMGNHATSAAFVEGVFDGHRVGDSNFSWSPDVSLGWIEGRDLARYRGNRYSTSEDAWLLAAGARVHYGTADDWYRHLFVSFQPALNSARTQALSTAYEFVSTLGWQGQRFSVQVRHVSNGNLHHPNRGETMLLLGVGFEL